MTQKFQIWTIVNRPIFPNIHRFTIVQLQNFWIGHIMKFYTQKTIKLLKFFIFSVNLMIGYIF